MQPSWKLRLVKGLYDRGLDGDDIRQLFQLIDWMLALPKELEEEFHVEIYRFEEEKRMPYVTSIERLAEERGMEKGLLEGVLNILEVKFGKEGKELFAAVKPIEDIAELRKLTRALKGAKTLEHARKIIRT